MSDEARIQRLANLSARNKRARAAKRKMSDANSEPDMIPVGEAAAKVVDRLSNRCVFVTVPRR